jgi:hypothetical protein
LKRALIKLSTLSLLLFVLAFLGCQGKIVPPALPTPQPAIMPFTTLEPSMKGWELYSWQKQGEWYFALVLGTNRLKTASEILASEGAVVGAEGIENELLRLPNGEQVFWGSGGMPEFRFPPADTVQALQDFCVRHGLALTVIPQR